MGIKIGDTVNIIDSKGKVYVSARIMKLVTSESNKKYTATLGNYITIDSVKEYVWDEESNEEVQKEVSAQDDTDAMLVDHEYRLTMLELGL